MAVFLLQNIFIFSEKPVYFSEKPVYYSWWQIGLFPTTLQLLKAIVVFSSFALICQTSILTQVYVAHTLYESRKKGKEKRTILKYQPNTFGYSSCYTTSKTNHKTWTQQ